MATRRAALAIAADLAGTTTSHGRKLLQFCERRRDVRRRDEVRRDEVRRDVVRREVRRDFDKRRFDARRELRRDLLAVRRFALDVRFPERSDELPKADS